MTFSRLEPASMALWLKSMMHWKTSHPNTPVSLTVSLLRHAGSGSPRLLSRSHAAGLEPRYGEARYRSGPLQQRYDAMKSILTPAAGSDSDLATFETALAAARPLGAHLEFLHIRISPTEAAHYVPHLDFAPGAVLHQALQELEDADKARSAAAASHVREFCGRHGIELGDRHAPQGGVSAAFREEAEDAVGRLMRHARHNDLIVLGRAAHRDSLPDDLIEQLLVGCGRPVLLAAPKLRPSLLGTVMVCWQETAQAARALGAALPLLAKSDRVLIARVDDGGSAPEDAAAIARYLAWYDIEAQTYDVPSDGRAVAELLGETAAKCEVDLAVMGGYSRSRTLEHVFGGCTQSFIERADRPVLLMH